MQISHIAQLMALMAAATPALAAPVVQPNQASPAGSPQGPVAHGQGAGRSCAAPQKPKRWSWEPAEPAQVTSPLVEPPVFLPGQVKPVKVKSIKKVNSQGRTTGGNQEQK